MREEGRGRRGEEGGSREGDEGREDRQDGGGRWGRENEQGKGVRDEGICRRDED